MLLGPVRLALRLLVLVLAGVVVYFAVTLVQVWLTSRHYDPRPAQAIVVMGAAQYNGVPSPDLRARLNEAVLLYHQGYSRLLVVTGSKEIGDQFTEAQAGDRYLRYVGVPERDIIQAAGSDSYENLSDAAALLEPSGDRTILIATDPFHEDRSLAIASSLGLTAFPTPTRTSPIRGWAVLPHFLREAAGVCLGRILGYGRLSSLLG
jgi:vancomycin permeability regulator SanA